MGKESKIGKSDIVSVFEKYGKDKGGTMDLEEFCALMRRLHPTLFTDQHLGILLQAADADRDGRVSIDDFVGFCMGGATERPLMNTAFPDLEDVPSEEQLIERIRDRVLRDGKEYKLNSEAFCRPAVEGEVIQSISGEEAVVSAGEWVMRMDSEVASKSAFRILSKERFESTFLLDSASEIKDHGDVKELNEQGFKAYVARSTNRVLAMELTAKELAMWMPSGKFQQQGGHIEKTSSASFLCCILGERGDILGCYTVPKDQFADTYVFAEASTVEFMNVTACSSTALGVVVHYKGFGQGIDFNDPATMHLADETVACLSKKSPDTVVWDGDSYNGDSFTYLIPRIQDRTKARLVMFLKNSFKDRKRVRESWSSVKLPITCYLCDPDIEFDKLGMIALQTTKSDFVVSFGGGVVVQKEFEHKQPNVEYCFVTAPRKDRKTGHLTDYGPLGDVEAPGLLHIRGKL